MCLATSKNLLLVLQDGKKRIFWTRDLLVSPKNDVKTLFFPHSIAFPCNFCKRNNNGIFTASQFYVQLPLLYTAWSNAYSEIGPEVTLRPLATSCAKDYKYHSLVQTSITEPPHTELFIALWTFESTWQSNDFFRYSKSHGVSSTFRLSVANSTISFSTSFSFKLFFHESSPARKWQRKTDWKARRLKEQSGWVVSETWPTGAWRQC